ncbi:MAG: hypothetical protein COU90_02515 [Candidatus Ryanbacteria bacterium CG10_big_fil_rev_8_21_14_0_10_43_42]|uniref:Uncharacterized protein n=1 Tax=Candidatus Ryanbacteria bacterium CG10_big_fil_rev_8_21_14_0_10_43_42 TaxID=1974864 RepID=A0A2M8KWK0_9BACT|nr:MAG: hypothetical protein COU90_02515 [Candidatus Ryanbacteria bacterium CG10_big_fil_rev_8_21_14_0_10_43_42]
MAFFHIFPISTTAILLLFITAVGAYGSVRLSWRVKEHADNPLFWYFRNSFIAVTFFGIIFVIPFLFTPYNETVMVWGYITAQAFLTLAAAWLAALFARYTHISPVIGFFIILAIGAFEVYIHITHLPVFNFTSFETHNIQQIIPSRLAGSMIALKLILGIIPLSLASFYFAATYPGETRRRSFLIAIGLFLWVAGGPLHDFANSTFFLLADIITLAGFGFILFGLLTHGKTELLPSVHTEISQ